MYKAIFNDIKHCLIKLHYKEQKMYLLTVGNVILCKPNI